MDNEVKIIECPRDAMQGIQEFIPTELKIRYLNALLKVGFHTLDFGSFVSPKAVPQMADTAEVLKGLELSETKTKLLAIVVNERGMKDACRYEEIHYLGYPFSISETFQMRNSRKSITDSVDLVKKSLELGEKHQKEVVIYISMGFGNPYGDPWSPEIAADWVRKMADLGVKTLSMADTVGEADEATIAPLFSQLTTEFPDITIGAHFHSAPDQRKARIQAAWDHGCRQFDTALQGFGGCPFAEDELVGNLATESLLEFLQERDITTGLDLAAFQEALKLADKVFGHA